MCYSLLISVYWLHNLWWCIFWQEPKHSFTITVIFFAFYRRHFLSGLLVGLGQPRQQVAERYMHEALFSKVYFSIELPCVLNFSKRFHL